MKEKETSIARHLNANPDAIGPRGSNLTFEVVEHLVENYHGFNSVFEAFPTLAHSLERDGYELASEGLRRKLPSEIPLAEQQSQFVQLLDKHKFNIAKGHYDQAMAAHARGEWAAANAGQLRSLVEEFFDRAYTIVCPGTDATSNARRIAVPAKAGFFVDGYNEFLFNGTESWELETLAPERDRILACPARRLNFPVSSRSRGFAFLHQPLRPTHVECITNKPITNKDLTSRSEERTQPMFKSLFKKPGRAAADQAFLSPPC